MNANILEEKIIENPEYIKQILESLGFEHIIDRGRYYQFPNKGGDNMTACSIYKSSLVYKNFTHCESGNLFTLCMSQKALNFPQILKWISHEIGISSDELQMQIRIPFGGFYKDVIKECESPEETMKTYDESILSNYTGKFNTMFLRDGVGYEAQEKFNLGYSLEENVILIPIYNYAGELVGCKARNNDTKCEPSERWFAFIPFAKTYILYGYHINYKDIIQKDLCVIFEAEKSVMQCASMNCNVALAVLGHDISSIQAKHIKGLKTKRILIAFDEGIPEKQLIEQAQKLKINNKLLTNQVGYIYDEEHKYLPEGSKYSPSDQGREVFNKLVQECVKWI